MGLFSSSQMDAINQAAEKSKQVAPPEPIKNTRSINAELNEISRNVIEYFQHSPAILITSDEQLHDYVTEAINAEYVGIDTETTGLDRWNDTIVGASLYYPGGVEAYIPMKHIVPIFDAPYSGQLDYKTVGREFRRLNEKHVKGLYANADFDLAMIYKDLGADMCDSFYWDVILAWRCLKENERHNDLKSLYNKYVLKGKGDPKRFSDFFPVQLFPYCKPDVAKLYAANDAKITYDLFKWQLPYVTKGHPKCTKAHLEQIAELIWNLEMPLVPVCQEMHRTGMYLDNDTSIKLRQRYGAEYDREMAKLKQMVQEILDGQPYRIGNTKPPFRTGEQFNPTSPPHVKYLLYDLMKLPPAGKGGTGKEVIAEYNLPITKQILNVRSLSVLINTFVDKMPNAVWPDQRIHGQFKQVGADTGRMCIAAGTMISCVNGPKPIQDIVPGDIVYCYDDDRNLRIAPVKNLWKTGENRPCVKIHWQSTGRGDMGELICTPEHRIRMKSGEWIEAQNLRRYDKLAHLRRTVTGPEYRPTLYGWGGFMIREQDFIKSEVFHAPSNMIIHHIDENPSNNDLSNLQIMSHSEHCKHHGKVRAARGQVSTSGLHSEESIQKGRDTARRNRIAKIKASKQQLLNLIESVNGRISYIQGVDYGSFLDQCRIAGIDVDAECRRFNPRYHKPRISYEEFIKVYNQYNGLAIRIIEHFNISYDKFYKYCDEYGISRNHMVQSVDFCGNFDVYDIEVEGYHNFIANEINVHNSSASPNLQNIPSHAVDIRHMFRATPRGYKYIECDDSETLDLQLVRYNYVTRQNGTSCQICDLAIGDAVEFDCNTSPVYYTVTDINSNIPRHPELLQITFTKPGGDISGQHST